jgi:hypothetical protein
MIYLPGVTRWHFWAVERLMDYTHAHLEPYDQLTQHNVLMTYRVTWHWLKNELLYGG